jgi:outer membrane lipoprotein-sorting protein
MKFKTLFLFTIFAVATSKLFGADGNALLSKWLEAQSKIQTWSADFTQTRTLKSFAQPLTSSGHVWFAAPDRFRWELGNPPQTIAVKNPAEMLVIYPKLKRAERYPFGLVKSGMWKDALTLLEAGFPRDRKELESRFNIEKISVENGVCELQLQPKSTSARKMMPQIKIAFGTDDFSLKATELQFADGSTMRNDFKNPKLNETFADDLFKPTLPKDFKIVEPLTSGKAPAK